MHSEAEPLEHTKKRDTGHQSVSLENKTGDSTVLKIGNSAKVVIKQDMKGRRHKYGFNNNKREKAEKKRGMDDETGDKHQLDEVLRMPCTCIMGSPPASTPPPPPPPPPPPSDASTSLSAVKRTRKASHLRSLSTRPPGAERLVVHVDPATRKADGPHRKKLRTYLGIVARDKAEFDIPEASDSRTKRKLLQTVGERWRQFKSDLTRKWALAADPDGVEDTVCEKYDISKEKWTQFCQTRRDPSWEHVRKKAQAIQKQNTAPHVLSRGAYDYLEQKLLAEKTKKKLEEAAQSGSVDGVIDPPSPIRRHVKWKMACTKKTGEMTTEAAKEITEKIGSFVPHGRQDVLAAAIGRPEHPRRVRAAGAGVTIKQYFGLAPRTSRSASSLPHNELQFESESYIKSSQRDVYLGAYLNGGHWQMVVILPKEHLVVWFSSLHNRPDNYLKGIINRQKGSTECGYYVMQWMSTIILGTFRNNWEAYFNDPRTLETERLKALRIQWAQFYLRVRDQA
ncbi:hypothetical protein HKD37_20G055614 [Glycine soja]